MASRFVCNTPYTPPGLLTIYIEVQAFAVWEKDAKDESGFVGYCYLDLFPRRKPIPLLAFASHV